MLLLLIFLLPQLQLAMDLQHFLLTTLQAHFAYSMYCFELHLKLYYIFL